MRCLQIPLVKTKRRECFETGWRQRSVFSFWKFLRVPGVALTALVSLFLWVNKTCREPGGVQRETFKAEMCSQLRALAGRGACTLKSGPGTRWTISSCQTGSSQFKGSSRQRCQVFMSNFTAAIKWLQAEKHRENLFTSQRPRPC